MVRERETADVRLDGFIDRYTPPIAALTRDIPARMRARLPGAWQTVYDNCNALVIGFGPTEKTSDAIFSITVYPRWVSLFFLKGAVLDDPDALLKGSGSTVRHIVLETADRLDDPPVARLIDAALADATPTIDPDTRCSLVIRSVSKKQRPRRPPK